MSPQQLPVDAEHLPLHATCAGCPIALGEEMEYRPYTARFELDVVPPDGTKCLVRRQTKHTYLPRQARRYATSMAPY